MAVSSAKERRTLIGAVVFSVAAGALTTAHWGGPVTAFVVAAMALLASLVGIVSVEKGQPDGVFPPDLCRAGLGGLAVE